MIKYISGYFTEMTTEKTLTCSDLFVINSMKVLLKKLARSGFKGGGLSRNEYILSNNVLFEESFL